MERKNAFSFDFLRKFSMLNCSPNACFINRKTAFSCEKAVLSPAGTWAVTSYEVTRYGLWYILTRFFLENLTYAAYVNEPTFYVGSGIAQLGVAPFIYGRMIDYGEGPIGFFKGLLIHICVIVSTFVVIFGIGLIWWKLNLFGAFR